jgi:tripartite-type tricarboxylate transporter receptor subunit TctC
MKFPRRRVLHLAAGAAAFPTVSWMAMAENFPSRPVRLIVGFPPGGPTDTQARLVAQWLSEQLGQPVLIDNRPGAGSNVGAAAVVNATPDGYTLLLVTASNTINATLYGNLSFDIVRDVAPVAGMTAYPIVLVVNPLLPVATIPELIAYAKANPGKINLGLGGVGSSFHVSGELFKMMAGIDLYNVPYRGAGPMITALLAGQIDVGFDGIPSSIGQIRAGKLRALAVTTKSRSDALPDVPTIGEFIPGFESSAWSGIGAPRGTPSDVIDTLYKAIAAALADPRLQARLADLGSAIRTLAPVDFGRFVAEETDKWGKVVRFSGAKPE